ncbi:GMC family oxidoreductase [Sandaracinobacteroides saxicola]|uniref:GMC family oxidoreductase n=1 Tax=Sandaracinobacteroides saxicola TaxID=2759707 RepID=A0A7G5IIA5_9SPHN|nr:GMC family oxidoreductase [Sandaracinobacteroides saxicola]QMW23097.1 GMC family oxidoreductase [Sandaracinobacteroides saxicola]
MVALSLGEPQIVIIGSGAAGGTVAHELTRRGHRVVLLEAGKRIEPGDFHQEDMPAYAQLSWLDPRVATGDWLAARVAPDRPAWVVKAVGGSTLHWNGLAYRAQPHELRARSTYGAVAGSSLADWPLDHAELLPWYGRAEAKLGVTGTHGIAAHPATAHYSLLHAGARRVGYRRISNARLAINSAARDDRPGCQQLGFCNQGCMISAKWSTLVSEIPKAEATGRLDLRTESTVVRIEHGADGRADAVVYADATGALHRQAAHVVVLAANSIETARLLLLSDSNRFPRGLANGSDQVGRNYMRHVTGLTYAVMPGPVNMHRGIVTPGTVFDEARHDPARGFAGGYLMEAAGLSPLSVALLLDPAGWGADYAGFIARYDHLAGMLMNGEELPSADNRVTLDDKVKDARGLPVARVHVVEHAHTRAMRAHFFERSAALYRSLGATDIRHGQPASATHNMGTARMGDDPATSVVDRFGRAHEVPNLWIVDGSIMPTSTAENPTLTIVALALRASHRLAGRHLSGSAATTKA